MGARFVGPTRSWFNRVILGQSPSLTYKLPMVLGSSGAAVSHTGNTNETQLAAVAIPPLGANDKLRITAFWKYTNSANNKILRVRFSGASGTVYIGSTQTTSTGYQNQVIIANLNATNAQQAINAAAPFNTTQTSDLTSSVDTSVSTTLYLSGQLASSGETVTLVSYLVELLPGV